MHAKEVKDVQYDADRKEEAGGGSRNAGERGDDGGTTGEQHGGHEDVRHETEDDVDGVRDWTIAGADDFEKGMGVWSATLEFNGQGGEEDDLHRGTRSVPKGARDAVAVGDGSGLQERGGPSP